MTFQEEDVDSLAARGYHHGKVIDVIVGKDGGLTYTPDDIHAKTGDTVRFHFVSKNHTVTESAFNDPCNPIHHGFDSGFKPIPAGSGEQKTFDVKVTQHEKPIWFYCKQFVPNPQNLGHCQMGMVGGINAPSWGKNTVHEFRQRARWSY